MESQISQTEPGVPHLPLASIALEPLLTRDYESRPTLFYDRLRAKHGPVAPVDVLGVPVWLVIGYPQMLEIMRDTRGIWSRRLDSWRARVEGRVPHDWPLMPAFEIDATVSKDGAELARLRGAWSAALRPFQERGRPQAKALEQAIAQYCDDLITLMTEGGAKTGLADLSAQYSRPLSLMIAGRLLGFEGQLTENFVMDIWRALDGGPDAAEAMARTTANITEVCAAKMANPGEDVPSYMLAALPDIGLDQLQREIHMMFGLLADHTGTLILNTALEVIIGDSGARDSVSAGMIQEAVNRAAISSPPMANLLFRFPKVDVRVGRYLINAGDPVMVSPAGAHGDPAFTASLSPDSIYSSRAHLTYGAGPHSCLGRDLVTVIATIAVGRLFERFSALRLALPPDQLPWRSSPLMRSLRALPINYEVAPRPTGGRTWATTAPAARPGAAAEQEAPLSLARRIVRALTGKS
jgi:cytochrome P450